MSETLFYIENLTDAELYNELTKRGFPAGPVVASTRRLYRHKLSQLLDNIHGREQEPLQNNDEMEEKLTHPMRMDGSIGENKPEYPRARSSLSHIHPSSHSGDAPGKSSSLLSDTYYSSSREHRKDDLRPYSSLSSSYLNSSVTEPSTSSPRRMYGYSTDISFGKTPSFGTSQHTAFSQVTEENPGYYARQRGIFSDTSPATRQEMGSQYRFTGYSDGKSSLLHRHTQERQRSRASSLKVRLILFATLIIAAVALSCMVYNAWSENDPYQQIEEDISKLVEEMKPVGN